MIQTAAVAGSTAAVAVTAGPALVTMAGYDLMTIGAATGSTTLFSAGTSTVAAGGTIAATLWGVGQATHPTPAAGEGYNDRLRITEQYEYGECFQCAKAMNDTFGDPVTVVHNASRNFPDDLTFYGANGEPIGSTGYHMYTTYGGYAYDNLGCQGPACVYQQSLLAANPRAVVAGPFGSFSLFSAPWKLNRERDWRDCDFCGKLRP